MDFPGEQSVYSVENDNWEAIKQQLHGRLTPEAYQNWVARTRLVADHGSLLRVLVPDDVTRLWLEHEYAPRVQTAIRELNLPVSEVVYEVAAAAAASGSRQVVAQAAVEPHMPAHFISAERQLNPRLGFESFIVGSCNQFAHAAARAVAGEPAKSYNPLFIYGGSGMGKTHLLHAIGLELLSRYPQLRVVCTSGERFINEAVTSIRTQRMDAFHAHYRTADILLMDDVHLLGGKERTQEEFFHTFNTLHGQNKQLVISSDRSPKSMSTLEERLRSRFEWGLTADIQPPDVETRQAILRAKAERAGRDVPAYILEMIARKVQSNIRELEGALNRVLAFSDLSGIPLTLELAQQALADFFPQGVDLKPKDVLEIVSQAFGISNERLLGRERTREVALPRQVAMYLLREEGGVSLPQIGEFVGGRDHTTVIYACEKVTDMMETDDRFRRQILRIREQLYGHASVMV